MLQPAVYIMTNRPRGVLYIGVTSNLQRRVWRHRNPQTRGFAERYYLRLLVCYEVHEEMIAANRAQETAEEMAKGVEDRAHREREAVLGQFVEVA